jgi:hypothetical protein
MLRRSVAALVISLASLVLLATPATARLEGDSFDATPGTTSHLPGTTLEAQERDDGNTSQAQWLIGAGLVSLVVVGVGGAFLKRHQG